MNRLARGVAIMSLALALGAAPTAHAGAIVAGFDSNAFPGSDDGSIGPVSLSLSGPLNFLGNFYDSVFVNNNGNVTFDDALSTFTPFGLLATNRVIIAPFFADVDTRSGPIVTYGNGVFEGRTAFGVNWPGVGYFSRNTDKTNNFQLLLVDRSDTGAGNFDIIFNYDQIQWETGDASGGSNGIGGNPTRVGYANGGSAAFELPGSGVSGFFLDGNLATGLIHNSRNSNVLGRYVFTVRNGEVVSAVPEPSSIALASIGIGLVGWRARRRKRPTEG